MRGPARLDSARERFEDAYKRLRRLPIGGTAIGTGINADARFAKKMAQSLTTLRSAVDAAADKFEGIASQDDAVELSGRSMFCGSRS